MNERRINIPRLMVVGTASGIGKTSLVCGLLTALKNRGIEIASFKCGPDYIDPMFHRKAIGIQSRNLDLFMCGPEIVKYLLGENSKTKELIILEGVMGVYDGAGSTNASSSNDLALVTNTPQILVIDPKGQGYSVGATVYGFLNFRPNNIKGIILNNTSAHAYNYYKKIIEESTGAKVYGHLPKLEQASVGSRHLGLTSADEIDDIGGKLQLLGDACENHIDLDGLIDMARQYAAFQYHEYVITPVLKTGEVKIAVALDKAFCFHYQDNIDLLKKMGAEVCYFSPLNDKHLPDDINGLIFYGGYPEEHAAILAANKTMLEDIKQALSKKIPTMAECGGFVYLGENLTLLDGQCFSMVNAIDTKSYMTETLNRRFGYVKIEMEANNLILKKGAIIKGHEFHYSDSSDSGQNCIAFKTNGSSYRCIHASEHLFAGFPHLHLWGNIEAAINFVTACAKWKNNLLQND